MEVKLLALLTVTLIGGGCLTSRHSRFNSQERPSESVGQFGCSAILGNVQ